MAYKKTQVNLGTVIVKAMMRSIDDTDKRSVAVIRNSAGKVLFTFSEICGLLDAEGITFEDHEITTTMDELKGKEIQWELHQPAGVFFYLMARVS